ncbi:integrase catalytic domain-containing protein [Trichonephila clavipes]|nr:integrase catalytic domain-containing protein [Trichonephila clavipes]
MGNLPYERVNMAPPFSITGLDLGGPYFVTYKHQRKGVLNKIYVCVSICFVTRAIHLEILSDLTSDAIIATLKRFMSRRGKCSKIFTDNAINFVGANSQLKVFYKTLNFPDQNLAAYFTEEGIEWNFIPPRAPHMGGLWEAGIKSVKYHLKRALGRSRLTYEEFETVIIQCAWISEHKSPYLNFVVDGVHLVILMIYPNGNGYFQPENASCHIAGCTVHRIEMRSMMMSRDPQSPYLSPVYPLDM